MPPLTLLYKSIFIAVKRNEWKEPTMNVQMFSFNSKYGKCVGLRDAKTLALLTPAPFDSEKAAIKYAERCGYQIVERISA